MIFTCPGQVLSYTSALTKIDKSGASLYHFGRRLNQGHWLMTLHWLMTMFKLVVTCYEFTACISLVGTTCSKSVTIIKMLTTCFRLVTKTGNKQCEHILMLAWQQPSYNMFANLLIQLLSSRYQDVFALPVPSCCDKSGTTCYHLVTEG
jgi:hypothetical protein